MLAQDLLLADREKVSFLGPEVAKCWARFPTPKTDRTEIEEDVHLNKLLLPLSQSQMCQKARICLSKKLWHFF